MKPFLYSFVYAARGVVSAVRSERNLRFHLCAACYVLFFSRFYRFTKGETLFLMLLIAGVIALELVNSAIERMVDSLIAEEHEAARYVKDVAAGAVLVFCIGAAVCGVLLFWDVKTIGAIAAFFAGHLLALVLFLLSLFFSAWFIFCFGQKKGS